MASVCRRSTSAAGAGVAEPVFAGRDARVPAGRRADRRIPSHALSAERAMHCYPPGTSREELLRQFRLLSEGGRLVDMGAAGIAVARR
jgi:hypothetical protein